MKAGRYLLAVLLISAVCGQRVASAADPLRVMTFNIRYATAPDGANAWEKRKELLLETIRKFGPDLLGMQESLDVQTEYVKEQLADYVGVGVGRDDGKKKGEASPILFKKSRFDLAAGDTGTFWLSETPDKPGSKSWDSSLPRIATWVKLRDKTAAGRELCYLNTHWDHRGNQARVESAKLIRNWLNDHARSMPAIVSGDLNLGEDHVGYRTLITGNNPHLLDVFRQLHAEPAEDEATFHDFNGRVRGKRIDFILATPDLPATAVTIDRTNRDGRYPSDHYPVTAVLKYER